MSLTPQDPDHEVELVDDLEELDAFGFDAEDEDAGGFDLGSLLAQAQSVQQQLLEAQAEVASEVVEGHAGGGAVRISVTGGFEFVAVHLDPGAVDAGDVEMLQDLILAALHDASAKVNELNGRAVGGLGQVMEGLGGAFGGLLP